jgi:hypothetical protein
MFSESFIVVSLAVHFPLWHGVSPTLNHPQMFTARHWSEILESSTTISTRVMTSTATEILRRYTVSLFEVVACRQNNPSKLKINSQIYYY